MLPGKTSGVESYIVETVGGKFLVETMSETSHHRVDDIRHTTFPIPCNFRVSFYSSQLTS